MAVTPDGNIFWLSTSADFEELRRMRNPRIGMKAIVLKPDANSPSFYVYTSKEEWESMA